MILSILHQYYINTTFSQYNTTQYYKSAFQYYLNTTNQHFNTTSILHCILCNSILPNTTNTTKVQYYISINTTQYDQYYQYYKGQLADAVPSGAGQVCMLSLQLACRTQRRASCSTCFPCARCKHRRKAQVSDHHLLSCYLLAYIFF